MSFKNDFADIVDIRDGLNPSLRKLLIVLNSMLSEKHFTRSSDVAMRVADITGGDFENIYDVMLNMAWPRSELAYVWLHGNCGFPPAHPDFSEVRLTNFGKSIIARANDRDFNAPFDVPIPYAFACGTIWCETKIPSHNTAEVIDAMIALMKNPNLKTKDLLRFIKGPDLLFGGTVENSEELAEIYEKGSGNIKVLVTPENFNAEFTETVHDYCEWYGLKIRKVYRKDAYRIELPYCAFMSDGEKCELMSLKKMLEKHLGFYRNKLSDGELLCVLATLKEQSSQRKTKIS